MVRYQPTSNFPVLRERICSVVALRMANKNLEVGIRTAQLLLDSKRHDTLVDDMKKRFPVVPRSALEAAVTMVGSAVGKVAPDQLRQALTPGGMEEIRPQIREAVVDMVLDHPTMECLTLLSEQDKGRLLGALVDLVLDQLLKDAHWVLSAPEVRLEALEDQIRAIHVEMGRWRLIRYRIRQRPWQYSGAFLATILTLLVVQQGSISGACQVLQSSARTTGRLLTTAAIFMGRWLHTVGGQVKVAAKYLGRQVARLRS